MSDHPSHGWERPKQAGRLVLGAWGLGLFDLGPRAESSGFRDSLCTPGFGPFFIKESHPKPVSPGSYTC